MKREKYKKGDMINGFEYIQETSGIIESNGRNRRAAIFACPLCNKPFLSRLSDLKSGRIVSCGCKRIELGTVRLKKHGLKYNKIYNIWRNIKQRCYDINIYSYKNYGGRGIIMHDSWVNSVVNFYNYIITLDNYDEKLIGNGSNQLSLDRIDNDGNYVPGNLRWATRKQQNNNRRK